MLTPDSPDVRRDLQHVQERVAILTAELRRAEAEHDRLVLHLADNDGASDRRVVAVR